MRSYGGRPGPASRHGSPGAARSSDYRWAAEGDPIGALLRYPVSGSDIPPLTREVSRQTEPDPARWSMSAKQPPAPAPSGMPAGEKLLHRRDRLFPLDPSSGWWEEIQR
nr:hypothetical protein GCM10020093_001590 [Planobispora longispora]